MESIKDKIIKFCVRQFFLQDPDRVISFKNSVLAFEVHYEDNIVIRPITEDDKETLMKFSKKIRMKTINKVLEKTAVKYVKSQKWVEVEYNECTYKVEVVDNKIDVTFKRLNVDE